MVCRAFGTKPPRKDHKITFGFLQRYYYQWGPWVGGICVSFCVALSILKSLCNNFIYKTSLIYQQPYIIGAQILLCILVIVKARVFLSKMSLTYHKQTLNTPRSLCCMTSHSLAVNLTEQLYLSMQAILTEKRTENTVKCVVNGFKPNANNTVKNL